MSIIPDAVDEETFFVYTGIVNEVKNLVARLDAGGHVAVCVNTGAHYWYYDEESDELAIIERQAPGWSSGIIEGSGRPWTVASAVSIQDLSKDNILFKCNPAE